MKEGDLLPTSATVLAGGKLSTAAAEAMLFGRGRCKFWALAAISLLAFWSMLASTVTLKWTAGNLKGISEELDSLSQDDLDILELEEREMVVRHMWDVYTHSRRIRFPRFWQEAFEAAYEDLASDEAEVRAPTPSALPAPDPPTVREQWEGEFSRFFIFQLQNTPTVRGRYCRGTWLTASSPATILIVKASSSDVAVLSISVAGYIHEEHIVSSLHLTWPQVACVPQCPVRGSRVVFMSYRDCSNQIQKFVVRFLTCADAETFIYFFKDCSRDTMDFAYPASDLLCDSSSPSKMIASNALQYKSNESESYEEAITNDMPSPAFGQDESYRPLPLVNSSNTIFPCLPPTFTELLTNCSKYPQNEISKQLEEANHALSSGESAPHLSPRNVSKQIVVLDADMKNEIARYMSDASFHDLVFTIEKVFHEVGGGLAL